MFNETRRTAEGNKFDLNGISGYQNPNIDLYQKLIASRQGRLGKYDTERYAQKWIERGMGHPKLKFLANHLRNEVLVDLGSGFNDVYQVAKKQFQVRALVAVETEPRLDRSRAVEKDPTLIERKKDMLLFCAELQDGSCNVTINGIDSVIIHPQEYHQYLAQEITRVTKPGGLIFGRGSNSLDLLNKSRDVRRVKFGNLPYDHYSLEIFEKIK